MKQQSVKTFQATIFCGFRPGYNQLLKFDEDYFREAKDICQEYCNSVGLGLTIKPTHFGYKDGEEPGVEIGLINYPRFPKQDIEIKNISLELATKLKEHFKQIRVSIVFTDETIMLE